MHRRLTGKTRAGNRLEIPDRGRKSALKAWWSWNRWSRRQGRGASVTWQNAREQQVEGKASRSARRRGKALARKRAHSGIPWRGRCERDVIECRDQPKSESMPESVLSLASGLETRRGGRRSIDRSAGCSSTTHSRPRRPGPLSLLVSLRSSSWRSPFFILCFLMLSPGVSVWAR